MARHTSRTARIVAALACAALLGVPSPQSALAANHPDLKLEYVGRWGGPSDERGLQFRITNVGTGPASAGKAHVQTFSPQPASVAEPAYPALAPGQAFAFRYELAAPCNGHLVKAGVSAVADGEQNYANNFFEGFVCAEKAAPAPSGPIVFQPGGLATEIWQLPEHMRRGEHTLVFESKAERSMVQEVRWNKMYGKTKPSGMAVGWSQFESALSTDIAYGTSSDVVHVAQTAVAFDLAMLDEIPRKIIGKALLTFDEEAHRWTNSVGRFRPIDGCVAVLGIASSDWVGSPRNTLFPNSFYDDVIPGSARSWDVTSHVREQMRFPNEAGLRHGYVLRGALEQLDADDDTSCMSIVSNIHLTVNYVVLD